MPGPWEAACPASKLCIVVIIIIIIVVRLGFWLQRIQSDSSQNYLNPQRSCHACFWLTTAPLTFGQMVKVFLPERKFHCIVICFLQLWVLKINPPFFKTKSTNKTNLTQTKTQCRPPPAPPRPRPAPSKRSKPELESPEKEVIFID